MDEQWIRVDRWSSLKAGIYKGKFAVMRGRPTADGVTSPEYTIKSDWQRSKCWPVKKVNGEWCVLPPGFSLGDKKEQALNILQQLQQQIERL